ncbi:WW domain binding protein 1, isoform CRA_c, partial [Mus musculus]
MARASSRNSSEEAWGSLQAPQQQGSGCFGLSSSSLAAVVPSATEGLNSGCNSNSGSVKSTCWLTMGHATGLALFQPVHCLTFASSAPSNPQPTRMWFTTQAHRHLLTLWAQTIPLVHCPQILCPKFL